MNEERYVLRMDLNKPEEERRIVQVLLRDMGGKNSMLVRFRKPGEEEWEAFRCTPDGKYCGALGEHELDLVVIKPERWGLVYFKCASGPYVYILTFSSEDEAKTFAKEKGYLPYAPFRYPDLLCSRPLEE